MPTIEEALYIKLEASDPTIAGALHNMLCEIHFTHLINTLQLTKPEVLVIGCTTYSNEIKDRIIEAKKHNYGAVYVCASQYTEGNKHEALISGARDFFSYPVSKLILQRALEDYLTSRAVDPSKAHRSKVIAVMGARGGSGTTSVAVNLAACFAKEGKQVGLLDFSRPYGDVATFLNTPCKRDRRHAAKEIELMNASYMKSAMYHHSSGILALVAPEVTLGTGSVVPETVSAMIIAAADAFRTVVIDMGSRVDAGLYRVMEMADDSLLITMPTKPCMGSAKRFVQTITAGGFENFCKLSLVLNGCISGNTLSKFEMEKTIGVDCITCLPDDQKGTFIAINDGTPYCHLFPDSPLTNSLQELAVLLHQHECPDDYEEE
ncbi:AAA family ATPase [Halodesulfovibrio marinisediminis]|uniref:Flp pilus assembly protein, ATPase CpaE n=1 Tax=Halodesulfovibrio marinisediminis DSM 17456 TaxID=1121457 RepID=A0A1N6FW26_9BACT|nr:P-loop NTPase [Halodesulfovibrio marinisediminis]SIN99400.1 Flp pilus assembly protein, ATPase CpaE [Halodesulfovibrio marinisediminis DSM 17456]